MEHANKSKILHDSHSFDADFVYSSVNNIDDLPLVE